MHDSLISSSKCSCMHCDGHVTRSLDECTHRAHASSGNGCAYSARCAHTLPPHSLIHSLSCFSRDNVRALLYRNVRKSVPVHPGALGAPMGNRPSTERRLAGDATRQPPPLPPPGRSVNARNGPTSSTSTTSVPWMPQQAPGPASESPPTFTMAAGTRHIYAPSLPIRPLTEVPYYPYLRYRVVVEDEYGSLLVVTREGLRRQRDAIRVACETEADPYALIALATWQQRKARVSPVELDQVCPPQRFASLEANDAHTVETTAAQTCSICLENFAPESAVRKLPRCGHVFHDDCIRGWACHKRAQCPVCRTWVLDDADMLRRSMAEAAIRAELQHAALVEERIREYLRRQVALSRACGCRTDTQVPNGT
jgi:hypothetical protein